MLIVEKFIKSLVEKYGRYMVHTHDDTLYEDK
jgi:hypothetical protein